MWYGLLVKLGMVFVTQVRMRISLSVHEAGEVDWIADCITWHCQIPSSPPVLYVPVVIDSTFFF